MVPGTTMNWIDKSSNNGEEVLSEKDRPKAKTVIVLNKDKKKNSGRK